jgi:hypothetical protein
MQPRKDQKSSLKEQFNFFIFWGLRLGICFLCPGCSCLVKTIIHPLTKMLIIEESFDVQLFHKVTLIVIVSIADPGCVSRNQIFPSQIQGQKDSGSDQRICMYS